MLIHGAHQGVSAAGVVYLAAMPARTRIQLLRGPRPASDGTLDPAPAPTAGMTTLEALYSQPFDGACVRLRVRVVTLMRLNMRWACTQCGCDVPEVRAAAHPASMRSCRQLPSPHNLTHAARPHDCQTGVRQASTGPRRGCALRGGVTQRGAHVGHVHVRHLRPSTAPAPPGGGGAAVRLLGGGGGRHRPG